MFVLLVNFVLVEREYKMSKMIESIHGWKRDSYQDIEDPNQTITQLSNNSRALYEDLVIPIMILMIQPWKIVEIREVVMRMVGLDQVEKTTLLMNPHPKTWRMYG